MTELDRVLDQLAPLWIFSTALTGFLMGHFSRPIEIEGKVIFLLGLFAMPFIISRLIVALLDNSQIVSDSGTLGAIYLIIYIIAIFVGRMVP